MLGSTCTASKGSFKLIRVGRRARLPTKMPRRTVFRKRTRPRKAPRNPFETDTELLSRHVVLVVRKGWTASAIEALHHCVLARRWAGALRLLRLLARAPKPPLRVLWQAGLATLRGLAGPISAPGTGTQDTASTPLHRDAVLRYQQALASRDEAEELRPQMTCEIALHRILRGDVDGAYAVLHPLISQYPYSDDVGILGTLGTVALAIYEREADAAAAFDGDDSDGESLVFASQRSQTAFLPGLSGAVSRLSQGRDNASRRAAYRIAARRALDRLRNLHPLDTMYLRTHLCLLERTGFRDEIARVLQQVCTAARMAIDEACREDPACAVAMDAARTATSAAAGSVRGDGPADLAASTDALRAKLDNRLMETKSRKNVERALVAKAEAMRLACGYGIPADVLLRAPDDPDWEEAAERAHKAARHSDDDDRKLKRDVLCRRHAAGAAEQRGSQTPRWDSAELALIAGTSADAEQARLRFLEEFDYPIGDVAKWKLLVHILYSQRSCREYVQGLFSSRIAWWFSLHLARAYRDPVEVLAYKCLTLLLVLPAQYLAARERLWAHRSFPDAMAAELEVLGVQLRDLLPQSMFDDGDEEEADDSADDGSDDGASDRDEDQERAVQHDDEADGEVVHMAKFERP